MKYITQIREHKLPFIGSTLYNYFYTCPECDSESNIVEWFVSMTRDSKTTYTCPCCKVKCLREDAL
jgi:hypothetical protein